MFTYPVQRQMFPWIARRISSSLGRGFRSSSAVALISIPGEQHAALHEDAVEEHRARASVAGVAADVAAGQVEVVAQEVDEQASRLHLSLVRGAVHLYGDRARRLGAHEARSFAACTARAASTSARWRRYSADAWTSSGGWSPAERTAPRTAFSSADSGRTSTGTASTQPTTTLGDPPSRLAATLTMQVPSRPIVSDAN